MDLIITNQRICAAMPCHSLCLDYQLPAVQQIFTKFLEKHPLIPAYKDCRFYTTPDKASIDCSSASYKVSAQAVKDQLGITLYQYRNSAHQWFDCDKNGCYVDGCNVDGRCFSYRFYRRYYSETGGCIESFHVYYPDNKFVGKFVPCDADVSLFDEYLEHSPITLEAPQLVPPTNATNAKTVSTPPPSGSGSKEDTTQLVPPTNATNAKTVSTPPPSGSGSKEDTTQPVPPTNATNAKTVNTPPPSGNGAKEDTTQPVPSPTATNAKTVVTPPSSRNAAKGSTTQPVPSPTATNAKTGSAPFPSGNSASQNSTSFSYLQSGLGAAGTLYCLYKIYKEIEKDEKGRRDVEASRLKTKTEGHAGGDSKNQASGWLALGYLVAAVASGAFTYYSIRA
jgi:hypothetical protein